MYKQITLLNFDGRNRAILRDNGDRNLNLLVKGGIKFEFMDTTKSDQRKFE